MLETNLAISIIALAVVIIAIYVLYSIILFPGGSVKGDDLQLSTKKILEQVEILFDKKEYALVQLLAGKYLDRVPGHFDVRMFLAKSYYEDKKYNQAIKQCGQLLKQKPNSTEAHEILGKCYIKKQVLQKALKEYEHIFEQRRTDKETIRTLAELYRATEQIYSSIGAYELLVDLLELDSDVADVQLILAELCEEVRDYPAALDAYKIRLSIYPNDIETNKKLVELYITIQNYPIAIETLHYMLSFATDAKVLQWTYKTLISLYEETDDFEAAITYSKKLLEIQGSDKFKIRNNIATYNIRLNRILEGITILEDLVMLSQNAFDITLELADAYAINKEYQKALDKYLLLLDKATPKEAKIINVLISDMYIKWAIEEATKKQYDTSFDLLKSAMQYNVINPEIYFNIAKNNYDLKKHAEAVDSISKALEYDKQKNNHVKYLLLLSEAHNQLGNFFEEKKALSDLLKLDPNNPQGLYRSGLMYASQHDIKNAEEAFKKAITYDPDLIPAKYNLALLYENNNKDKAKELFMEVLEQDPANQEAKIALTDLTTSDFF